MNKASCSLDAGFMSLHTVATKYMFYVLVENYLPLHHTLASVNPISEFYFVL